MYDKYRLTAVRELPIHDLQVWLIEELENLYRDFSQKIEMPQLKYEAKRLKEMVSSPQYNKWDCGNIHAALQTMIESGSYRKVSVFSIKTALASALKITQQENRIAANKGEFVNVDRIQAAKDAAYYAPYMKWWMKYNVDPKQVDAHMFNKAKKNGELQAFTDKWRDTRNPGFLTKELSK